MQDDSFYFCFGEPNILEYQLIFSAGEGLCYVLGFVGRQLAERAGTWPAAGRGKVDFQNKKQQGRIT